MVVGVDGCRRFFGLFDSVSYQRRIAIAHMTYCRLPYCTRMFPGLRFHMYTWNREVVRFEYFSGPNLCYITG